MDTLRKKYEKYSTLCKNSNSKYLISTNDTFPTCFSYIYPRDCFKETLQMNLGKEKYAVPIGYDEVLKIAFRGDYMILPAEEDRVYKHKVLEGEYEWKKLK